MQMFSLKKIYFYGNFSDIFFSFFGFPMAQCLPNARFESVDCKFIPYCLFFQLFFIFHFQFISFARNPNGTQAVYMFSSFSFSSF